MVWLTCHRLRLRLRLMLRLRRLRAQAQAEGSGLGAQGSGLKRWPAPAFGRLKLSGMNTASYRNRSTVRRPYNAVG